MTSENNGEPYPWATEAVPNPGWYEAWYQIADAKAVRLGQRYHIDDQSDRSIQQAKLRALKDAKEILDKELEKVCDVGLKVEAKIWLVRKQERLQTRTWPESDVDEYVTNFWYNSEKPKIISKKVWENEVAQRTGTTEERHGG